jgi:effector-binding domain-containing protein
MLTLPKIIERPAQPYAFITYTVTMQEMTKPADEGFSKLFQWLGANGIEPVAAPVYNYRRINMAETLDVEAGVPVAAVREDDGDIRFGMLPAGRYVELEWHGHFDGLIDATAMLIGWVRLTGHQFDVEEKADGDHFACRLEIYETEPDKLPPEEWVTRLSFKLRD